MKSLRIVEFCLSLLVLVASIGNWTLALSSKNPLEWGTIEWAFMFLILTIFPIVVLFGSYGHAFVNRERAFYFMVAGSFSIIVAITCLFVLYGMSGGSPGGTDLFLLSPAVLALLAVLVAVVVNYFDVQNGFTSGETLDGLP